MGLGARVLAEDAALRALLAAPNPCGVVVERVPPVDETRPEIWRVFELNRRLARAVHSAGAGGAFPLVFAGNCCSCLGTLAGAGAEGSGVVWFDSHADFDSPDDNLSGFTDVMGLAILTGTGWRALRETIPGFTVVAERAVILAGVRDLEPYQRARLEASAVRTVAGRIDARRFQAQLEALAQTVRRVYLHVDLDVLDASIGRANEYATTGGPTLEAMLDRISSVFDHFAVAAAALTAYDPRLDDEGAVLKAARQIAGAIAARAADQR